MVTKYFTRAVVFLGLAAQAARADNCGGNVERPATAHLQVLSYNDVYELKGENISTQYGVEVGGPSRVVPIAKKLRKTYQNSLVIFSGDTMAPSLWSSQFKGLQMIDAHNAIGVDFACLGNHDFDFGIDGFLNVSKASKFPWLNANAYEIGTDKLLRGTVPNAVKTLESPTMGKIKVGAFGVMYDMQDSTKGMRWTDPIQAAIEQVDYLRKVEKVDMVIALTHQFLDDDNVFSAKVKGVDIIYGGHDHAAMLQSQYGTTYIKSDLNFRSVWLSDIKYYAPTKVGKTDYAAFTKMSHKNLAVTANMPTDPDLDTVINKYDDKIKVLFNRTVGSLCNETDLTAKLVRVSEAPIGNFFADALKSYYKKTAVDVSVMNGGGIRSDKTWPAGDITVGDLVSWNPFGNIIGVIKTKGKSLKKFINSQMSGNCDVNGIKQNGQYMHMAGVKFTFVCSGSNAGTVTKLEWDGKDRSGDVKDEDEFNFALSDFMKGEFDKAGGVSTWIITLNEAARIEVVLEAKVVADNGSVCPKLDGRSVVKFSGPTP